MNIMELRQSLDCLFLIYQMVYCILKMTYIKDKYMMIDKKISNAQLKERAGFSANIITRLKRNEYVSIESIEKICRVMGCGVDDILEFVPEEK